MTGPISLDDELAKLTWQKRLLARVWAIRQSCSQLWWLPVLVIGLFFVSTVIAHGALSVFSIEESWRSFTVIPFTFLSMFLFGFCVAGAASGLMRSFHRFRISHRVLIVHALTIGDSYRKYVSAQRRLISDENLWARLQAANANPDDDEDNDSEVTVHEGADGHGGRFRAVSVKIMKAGPALESSPPQPSPPERKMPGGKYKTWGGRIYDPAAPKRNNDNETEDHKTQE